MTEVDDLEALKPFATTERQGQIIDSVIQHRSARAAARALGIHHSTVAATVKRVRKNAAIRGHSPEHDMTKVAPEPFIVRGVSTYYGKEGEVRGQWVKTKIDEQNYQDLLAALATALAEELPRLPPSMPPNVAALAPYLLNLYILTDVHLGMLASHTEGGADWDLKIAEQVVTRCFMAMMEASPAASTCIIGQMGDWFHFDGFEAVTDRSGHVLDASARFHEVMQAGVRLLRRLIEAALLKHTLVVVLIAEGNHDQRSANWLQIMFESLYENDPRVMIVRTPKPYYAHQHGKTALFFTHGHLSDDKSLPLLFASDFPLIWGTATKRYIHTGHKHTPEVTPFPGGIHEKHPTLAAKDAHASRHPWRSQREASSIIYHSEFGQVARFNVTPEMVSDQG